MRKSLVDFKAGVGANVQGVAQNVSSFLQNVVIPFGRREQRRGDRARVGRIDLVDAAVGTLVQYTLGPPCVCE